MCCACFVFTRNTLNHRCNCYCNCSVYNITIRHICSNLSTDKSRTLSQSIWRNFNCMKTITICDVVCYREFTLLIIHVYGFDKGLVLCHYELNLYLCCYFFMQTTFTFLIFILFILKAN